MPSPPCAAKSALFAVGHPANGGSNQYKNDSGGFDGHDNIAGQKKNVVVIESNTPKRQRLLASSDTYPQGTPQRTPRERD